MGEDELRIRREDWDALLSSFEQRRRRGAHR
jgi:hypothetical protein